VRHVREQLSSRERKPMVRVFISHSTRDRSFVEAELVPVLSGAGYGFWYSKDSIRTAELWERSIRAGLASCDWFTIVMSANSVASDYVKDESRLGSRESKRHAYSDTAHGLRYIGVPHTTATNPAHRLAKEST
jgi:hypothetical protein